VAFIDVLGFSALIRNAAHDKNALDRLLASFRRDLGQAMKHVASFRVLKSHPALWQVKTFSDNIVIGFPFYDDKFPAEPDFRGEMEVSGLLFNLALFQLAMVKRGWFFRGAVAVGEHYMDNNLVFGDAILEAVDDEKRACYPRILMSKSTRAYIDRHLKVFGHPRRSGYYYDLLLEDGDGNLFLDYLGLTHTREFGIIEDDLRQHRDQVAARLDECASNSAVYSKYVWTACYHNQRCTELGLDPGYIIQIPSLHLPVGRTLDGEPRTAPVIDEW